MQIAAKVVGKDIWAMVMRGASNPMCMEYDHWVFFARNLDIPWPVAHATVSTGPVAASIGSRGAAYIDWIDVPENQRREGWATRAVEMLRLHYGSIDYTSNEEPIADAFWDSIEKAHSQAALGHGTQG